MKEPAKHRGACAGGGWPRTTLRPDPSSAGAARRFISDVLLSRGLEPVAESAALLTSELVTNAVLYARSEVIVEVVISPSCVRIEVHDASAEPPVARLGRPDESVPGYGLEMVGALADSWGVDTAEEGKCVWFELRSAHDDEEGQLRRVSLLNVPAATYVAANLHVDQLLHELQTATGSGAWAQAAVSHRLHRLITRNLQCLTAARLSAWAQARQVLSAGGARVDIGLSVSVAAASADRQLVELLEEADALCAAGELLTLPVSSEVRRLRSWVTEELSSQLQLGRAPRPCPL